MNNNFIKDNVIDIVCYRSGYSKAELAKYEEESLLGPRFRVPARELLHILFDVENKFSISIPFESLSNNRFSSIKNIVDIIVENIH